MNVRSSLMAVNIHITIIELNALHTKRQNLFQELDAVIHLLMEAKHWGRSEERFSRNAETDIVCRLLLEKKKGIVISHGPGTPDGAGISHSLMLHTITSVLSCSPLFFFFLIIRPPQISTLFPYTTLFRSLMAVNIHITIIELNALHTKRQNLFQELDAVIHLLMEAKHWGLRKSRNATSLNSRFKSLDTLKVKIISVTFRRVIRTNHKKASKIWRHENIQLGGCQS